MSLNKFWIISLLAVLAFPTIGNAQMSWVFFQDKPGISENFFEAPVHESYLQELKAADVQVFGTSRWLNAACISDSDLPKVKGLSSIGHIETLDVFRSEEHKVAEEYNYGLSDWQIEMLNLHEYHNRGFTGKGVKLALFDAGFYKVDSLPVFQTLRDSQQIVATWDFVDRTPMSFRNSTHGMQVLALAGSNYPDSMVGASPGADFVLARTEETGRERHIEEYNWLNAMEWADSIGVDIIHSSLGYSLFDSLEGDYTYADMDGKSTIITLAAELAYSRGIFITNSAGNSGNDPWFHITAPCDGEHVLCVGAVDSNRMITGFSSRGPSYDGRIKPEVVAMGRKNTIPNAEGLMVRGSGTSFSGPLIAGLVACLKEAHPGRNNDEIMDAIIRSCDRYETPDSAYGYGLPDVLIADSLLQLKANIAPIKRLSWSLYPNPANHELRITAPPFASYRIVNNQGVEVMSGQFQNWMNFISVEALAVGHYTIIIDHEGIREARRWVRL